MNSAITGWQRHTAGHSSPQPCLNTPLTLAAVVREDGENKVDDFGGRGKAADTMGPGFSGASDTASHTIHLVGAVLWGQIQGFPAHRHKKEGTTGLKTTPSALNWCVSPYMRHIA